MATTEDRQRWIWKLETGGNLDVPWATARDLYRRVWPDVTIHEVRDVPALTDVTGNDLLLETQAGAIHIGQRFRKPFDGGVEFTLCCEEPDGSRSEHTLLKQGHGPDRLLSVPSLYALGISRERDNPGRQGFGAFYLIRLPPVFQHLVGEAGEVGNDGEPFEAHTGRQFWAYPWDSLRRVDALFRRWSVQDLQPDEVDPLSWGEKGSGVSSEPIGRQTTYSTR